MNLSSTLRRAFSRAAHLLFSTVHTLVYASRVVGRGLGATSSPVPKHLHHLHLQLPPPARRGLSTSGAPVQERPEISRYRAIDEVRSSTLISRSGSGSG